MKDEILDESFHDTFGDFLTKDEKILWKGFTVEPKDSIYTRNQEGVNILNYEKLILKILYAGLNFITLGDLFSIPVIVVFVLGLAFYLNTYLFFIILMLSIFIVQYYIKSKRTNYYAITSKRILFQFTRLPKEEIHSISFSDIKNCIVTLDSEDYGVLFLATKNPKDLSDKLFEKERHSPTLENIENPNQVAQILRQAIRDNSIS